MFLKRIDSIFQRISYRLAVAYLLFFIPCYLLTFGSFYYLAERYLRNRDRDLIESKVQFFEAVIQKEGTEGLQKLFSDPSKSTSSRRYFIEAVNENQQISFFHAPEIEDPVDSATLQELKDKSKVAKAGSWSVVPPRGADSDSMEIKTVLLEHGYRLSVGASTDDREDFLEAFKKFFFSIIVPFVIVSTIGSIYISQLVLRPLNILAETIQRIRSGALSSRAKIPRFKDELYYLSTAFNEMVSQIESLISAMKDTLDNIAHDIKTPLTRLRVSAELALQSGEVAQLKNALAENVENTDSLLRLIDTIMTVAQLNAKALPLMRENFNGKLLVEEIADLYSFIAEEKQVSLELPPNDFMVFADRNRMKQIVANLLDNAIKYSPAGSSVIIMASVLPGKIMISVLDNGIGIAGAEVEKIWERLYRSDKSRHEPGLGLGLSIVKALVEAHGGVIQVFARLEGGTEFRVELPNSQT